MDSEKRLERYTALIRRKLNIGPEIWSAAWSNEKTRGTGGPRSWIEEELEKQPDHTINQLAEEVTDEMIDFANGPFRRSHIWHDFRSGRDIMIAIVTAGVIALECQRHGFFTPNPELVNA